MLPNKPDSDENLESVSDLDDPYRKSQNQNINYRQEELNPKTKDDISGMGDNKKEITKSLDVRESALIQKKQAPERRSGMSGQPRPSVNEDILKGLRLSGNDADQKPKKLKAPPKHLMHQNTLMGNVKISNRNLNDSEIQHLESNLMKTGQN